jgi:hypothetical protein
MFYANFILIDALQGREKEEMGFSYNSRIPKA